MSSANEVREARIGQIAERVRALVAGRYGERVFDAALGIGMSDGELSALLLGRPVVARPEIIVGALARVVRHFGVDPSWLVTGRYNVGTHMAAEELGDNLVGLRFLLDRLLSGPDRAVEVQPIERADLRPSPDGPGASEDSGSTARPDQQAREKLRRGDEPER